MTQQVMKSVLTDGCTNNPGYDWQNQASATPQQPAPPVVDVTTALLQE